MLFNDPQSILVQISIWAIPTLLAITLHEAAHGIVAKWRGDTTAWMLGRVSLNPLRHIDLVGTIILPLIMIMVSPFVVGYAKPVPVNFNRLKNIRWDSILVAAAGPFTNFILAGLSILVLYLVPMMPVEMSEPVGQMAVVSVHLNILLMVLNLLPILPLDGGRIIYALLPARQALVYGRFENVGMIAVFGLALMGLLFTILEGPYNVVLSWLMALAPTGVVQ
jgi:Zn-dependent protease